MSSELSGCEFGSLAHSQQAHSLKIDTQILQAGFILLTLVRCQRFPSPLVQSSHSSLAVTSCSGECFAFWLHQTCAAYLQSVMSLVIRCISGGLVQVLSSVSDHTIRVWDAQGGVEVQRLVGHQAQVHILECHPFHHQLAMSASYDGTTKLWNLHTGQLLAR